MDRLLQQVAAGPQRVGRGGRHARSAIHLGRAVPVRVAALGCHCHPPVRVAPALPREPPSESPSESKSGWGDSDVDTDVDSDVDSDGRQIRLRVTWQSAGPKGGEGVSPFRPHCSGCAAVRACGGRWWKSLMQGNRGPGEREARRAELGSSEADKGTCGAARVMGGGGSTLAAWAWRRWRPGWRLGCGWTPPSAGGWSPTTCGCSAPCWAGRGWRAGSSACTSGVCPPPPLQLTPALCLEPPPPSL